MAQVPNSNTINNNGLKAEKTQEERLSEGVHLLKQLKDAGVKANSMGFYELKIMISNWVRDGIAVDKKIQFEDYGRIAIVSLPRYNNKVAGMNFNICGRR
jgi:hypothetical protein